MANLREDRGQILLIAAFTLAVIFVGLALVVNGAIFTQNLASQGEGSGGSQLLQQRAEVRQTLGTALDDLNEHGPNVSSDLKDDVEVELLPRYSAQFRRYTLVTGTNARIFPTATPTYVEGAYIEDEHAPPNTFEMNDGSDDWLLGNFDGARSIEFLIKRPIAPVGPNSFRFLVTGSGAGAETYEFTVGHDGSAAENPMIKVEASNDGEPNGNCILEGEDFPVRLDVTSARFGGEYCHALDRISVGEGVTTPATIEFFNADNIHGNYSMVVIGGSGPIATGNYGPDPEDPTWKRAIYSTTVQIGLLSEDRRFLDEITIAPEEGL